MPDDIYYLVAHRSQEEIDTFHTRYDRFEEGLIPEIFRKSLGLTVAGWQASKGWGSSHVIYTVTVKDELRPFVLRANTGFGKPETSMVVEKLLTDKVRAAGVPTNTILVADISRTEYPFDYQIQELLPGTDIESGFAGTKEEYDRMSYRLGQYIAMLSTVRVSGYGLFDAEAAARGELVGTRKTFSDYIATRLESDARFIAASNYLKPRDVDTILSVFQKARPLTDMPESVVVHHDLADHNLSFEDGTLTTLFDWEAAVAGDAVLDLASCPTWKTFYPREEQLLIGFTSLRPLPDHFEEKRNLYRLRTMLWKMMYAVRMKLPMHDRLLRFATALAPYGLAPLSGPAGGE